MTDLDATYHHGNTFYIGDFDYDMEAHLLIPFHRAIKRQAEEEDGRIDMFVNSYGGFTHLAFHLVEMMELAKSYGITVRTIVTDTAMSSGSIVAVAGTEGERYVARDATYLIHYGYVYPGNVATPVQAGRNADYQKNHFKRILNHYKKYCAIPDIDDHIRDDNWYFNAVKARRWGVADHYIDRLDLF